AASGAASAGSDNRDGHARPAVRAPRRPQHSPLRRPHRRGEHRRDRVEPRSWPLAAGCVQLAASCTLPTPSYPRQGPPTAMAPAPSAPGGYDILKRATAGPAEGGQTAARSHPRPMNETPIISLKNVEKFYQHGLQRTYVLRRVSLDFKPGEF